MFNTLAYLILVVCLRTCSMEYTGVPPGDDCKAIEEILRKSEDVICDRIERFKEASNQYDSLKI